jgi:hypothetical protein
MTPNEFRKFGHRLIDWLADYQAGVGERPVLGQVKRRAIRTTVLRSAQAGPRGFERGLAAVPHSAGIRELFLEPVEGWEDVLLRLLHLLASTGRCRSARLEQQRSYPGERLGSTISDAFRPAKRPAPSPVPDCGSSQPACRQSVPV